MKIKKLFVVLFSSVLVSGCASIVSKSKYDVAVSSQPTGAKFTVTDHAGGKVFAGSTPTTVTLKASAGYFKKQTYKIKLEKPGYQQQVYVLSSTVDGWYWGNFLIGGFIGMLAIDPLTGAMYKLPKSVMVDLDKTNEAPADVSLSITTVENLDEEQRARLELIVAK